MNSKDRATLFQALSGRLPPSYRREEHDDFVNFDFPEGRDRWDRHGSNRVFRVIGSRRHLVRFVYDDDPFGTLRRYFIEYLHVDGSWVFVDSKAVMEDAYRRKQYSFDKVMGEWLFSSAAVSFAGSGWSTSLANSILAAIPLWERANACFLWIERDGVRSSLVQGSNFCLSPRYGGRACCVLSPGHDGDHSDGRGNLWKENA